MKETARSSSLIIDLDAYESRRGIVNSRDIEPMVVPANWSSQKDMDQFISRFGSVCENCCPHCWLACEVCQEAAELTKRLALAAEYLSSQLSGIEEAPVENLSIGQLLTSSWPTILANPELPDDSLLPDAIDYISWTREHLVTLMEGFDKREEGWLLPWCHMADAMEKAKSLLWEAVVSSHPHFPRWLRKRNF